MVSISSVFFKSKELECKGTVCGPCKQLPNQEMINKLDEIRQKYNKPIKISSGFRCEKHNKIIKGAAASKHMQGNAADILDLDKDVTKWITPLLEEFNIWIEDPAYTPNWLHVQIVPYGSWKPGMTRIFKP